MIFDAGKETPHEFFTVIQNGLFLARFVFEFLNLRFLFDVLQEFALQNPLIVHSLVSGKDQIDSGYDR